MFGTEQECLKYCTLWDPDHRIEVAPGQYRALFADLFDEAVTTTAYAFRDYRTTPDLATRLMEVSGAAPPAAPSVRGLLGRILARKWRRQACSDDGGADARGERADPRQQRECPGLSGAFRQRHLQQICREPRSAAVVALLGLRHEAPGIRRGAAALRRPPEHSGCRRARYGRPRRPPRSSNGRGRRACAASARGAPPCAAPCAP